MNINISEKENGYIGIETPYNKDFVDALKERISGRRWDSENKIWLVPAISRDVIMNLLKYYYNYEEGSSEVTIEITAKEDIEIRCTSVSYEGFPVVRATGRDSGARVCDGVILVSGTIRSGGSVKNWESIVEEGAILRLTIPESAMKETSEWGIKIIEKKEKLNPLEKFSDDELLKEIKRRGIEI